MSHTVDIQIELREDAPEEVVSRAMALGREGAVLFLQQEGWLTIREAAAELGLIYEGYLDLLHRRGLPASSADIDEAGLDLLRRANLPRTARE